MFMRVGVALILALLLSGAPAGAWWPDGHHLLSQAAVEMLPPPLPQFFRDGATAIAHGSIDPDLHKNRALPNVTDGEYPEHYLDWELLEGRALPPTRYQFLALCAETKLDPKRIGLLPYAIAEETERLAITFAEHRQWPENPLIRAKCLVYAGCLAHYAADLCQPLHTTIHFDGRITPENAAPRTGIHDRVDMLIERLTLKPAAIAADATPTSLDPLFPAILQELERSHALIDRVYALEQALPPAEGAWTPSKEARDFGSERARTAARFTASLYLTAWERSAAVKLPPWLQRE